MWITLTLTILTVIVAINNLVLRKQLNHMKKQPKCSEPYNTMYIDHQHKLVQMTLKGKVSPEQKEQVEIAMQSYIDDGYKVQVLDDTFNLRIETKE